MSTCYTPKANWEAWNPDTPFYDGRCEVVLAAIRYRGRRRDATRCRKHATSVNEDGFAICSAHAKNLVFVTDEHPAGKATALEYDEGARQFRFGGGLREKIKKIRESWDF